MKFFPALAITLATLLGPIPGPAARAQNASAPPSPTITAQLTPSLHGQVIVPVLVHDKKGKLIPNLTAADFTLTDNTYPQTIQSFAPNTSLPLTLGIAAQTSPGTGAWLADERRSGKKFLTRLMTATRIQFFVIQFNLDVDLLEDPSPSTAKLSQAFHQLGMPQFNGDSNGSTATGSGKIHHYTQASGAALYDSIYLASSQVLNKESGRKALIVFTDGVDRGSKTTLNSAINAAQTAGVAIYAIYFKDTPPSEKLRHKTSRHGNVKRILAEICNQTGGEIFDSKRANLDTLLAQIADQINDAYMLQYTRTKASSDSGFHHIVLKPKQKDLFVKMTRGYWLPQK